MYMKGVNEKFANKIADLVVSQDPRDFQKAASAISRNPWAKRALQQNYDKMIKISAPSAHSMTPLGGYLGTKLSPASEDQQ
jgi:spore maturation protein CgeB